MRREGVDGWDELGTCGLWGVGLLTLCAGLSSSPDVIMAGMIRPIQMLGNSVVYFVHFPMPYWLIGGVAGIAIVLLIMLGRRRNKTK
jgi:predicted Na+-dependent transporter